MDKQTTTKNPRQGPGENRPRRTDENPRRGIDENALRGIVDPRRGIVGDQPRPPVDHTPAGGLVVHERAEGPQETPEGGQDLAADVLEIRTAQDRQDPAETPEGGQDLAETPAGGGLQEPVEDPLRGVLALATAALAPNSRTAYKRAIERLARSLNGQELNDQALAAHVQDLHNQGLAPASIAIVPAAVRYYARAHGSAPGGSSTAGPDPVGPLTKAALKIIRREGRGRGRGQAGGIRWEQADATAAVAGNGGQDLAGLRDAAIIAVMSDCLLRVSELAALDVQDVETAADGSARVHVRASKTDQEGKGETLYAGPPTAGRVQAWIDAAQVQDGPLFRRIRRGGHVQGSRLTPRAVAEIVKKRADAAGIDPASVSGHSLRVGAAQSLAAAGAGVVEMQTAGRWKSPDMPGRYARKQLAAKGAVAKLRHGK
ncbi:MAG: tyrosine-type recombinase/integrase [Gammaproteobacteria bacterium]|nr:tyrosine-type recombinase/integrase [Gammaproteobacteria bacterium]